MVKVLYGLPLCQGCTADKFVGLPSNISDYAYDTRTGRCDTMNPMPPHLRIARPVSNLSRTQSMYCRGLGLCVIGSFENHEGFDGVMLGMADASYHFEFTRCRAHPVVPAPTAEDLAVFYIPVLSEWQSACANMLAAGFKQVASFNPYWDLRGRTFEDPDGYRVVLQNTEWSNVLRVPEEP